MPFLLDLEKVYLKEKWPQLLSEIRLLLLKCYQMTSDSRREFKVRCQLSANSLLDDNKRLSHCLEAEKLLKTIRESTSESLNIRMEDIFEIKDISLDLEDNYTVTNRDIQLNLQIINNFPKDINCNQLLVSLKVEQNPSNTNLAKHKTAANGCPHMTAPIDEKNKNKTSEEVLKLSPKPEIETFHSSVSVGVKCNNTNHLLLRRSDSHGFVLQDKEPEVGDCSQGFVVQDLILKPGFNDIRLNYSTKESGTYILSQIVVNWNSSANLIGADIGRHICFAVIAEEPALKVLQLTTLKGLTNDILCGVEQSIELQLNCGSSSFPERLPLTIRGSRGLQIKLETDLTPSPLKDEIQFLLPTALKPFETFEIPIIIKSELLAQKDSNSVEHELTMSWPSNTQSDSPKKKWISVTFHLLPPFVSSYKLHTCDRRKFFEILVNGVSKHPIVLSDPQLRLPNDFVDKNQFELKPSLPKTDSILNHNQTVHYLWEIVAKNPNSVTNKLLFDLKFKLFDENPKLSEEPKEWEEFECEYKLQNYQTLYTIKEFIEPQNGTEFCRAGSVCLLNVSITRVNPTEDHNSIMYEIISDQTLWNPCGKTAGVVSIDGQTDSYEVTFEVMPLISGFLPFPTIRLSKYISSSSEKSQNSEQSEAKLLAFDSGQVYNWSRAAQIHVLPSSQLIAPEV